MTEPSAPVLLSDTVDGVCTLTLNRPAVRNALSSELLRALPAAMRAADGDPAVSAIVLTGTDPAFCAGLDLRELGSTGANLGASGASGTPGDATVRDPVLMKPWPPMTKPVIGAINGAAVTGGLELALNCDFLVASERATFGDTHTRVGIMPGWGLTVLLPQAIGIRRAREMSLTGNFLTATEALHFGLVNHVVPHSECVRVAQRLAADTAGNDGEAVRNLLASYHRATLADGARGFEIEAEAAREWQGRSFDPAEVERRREAVMARGRAQTGEPRGFRTVDTANIH